MQQLFAIPAEIRRRLGHYVYLYVDPRDEAVFYVGKGQGARALAHLDRGEDHAITRKIREMQTAGADPRIDILVHDLPSAEVALRVEAAAIDLLGIGKLANAVRGWQGRKYGRMSLDELTAHYQLRPIQIKEPAILIRINRRYRHGLSPQELYDVTRCAWKVGERRNEAKLAFAVFEGIVREVYTITAWLPAQSTFNLSEEGLDEGLHDRWEFVGKLAPHPIRKRYRNGSVSHFFPSGSQNPIQYVNVERS